MKYSRNITVTYANNSFQERNNRDTVGSSPNRHSRKRTALLTAAFR